MTTDIRRESLQDNNLPERGMSLLPLWDRVIIPADNADHLAEDSEVVLGKTPLC